MEEKKPGKINYFSLYHPSAQVQKAGIRIRRKRKDDTDKETAPVE